MQEAGAQEPPRLPQSLQSQSPSCTPAELGAGNSALSVLRNLATVAKHKHSFKPGLVSKISSTGKCNSCWRYASLLHILPAETCGR